MQFPAPPPSKVVWFLVSTGSFPWGAESSFNFEGGEDRESLEYVIGICLVINDHPGLQIYAMNSHFVFLALMSSSVVHSRLKKSRFGHLPDLKNEIFKRAMAEVLQIV